ncbi:DMT family transporter [Henriciella barbarensis]|uniref:DMT family transporter n=1 Tax=Henriciella barbarensis TaxID=86342 RepID=A0A399R230_9PROT|nr:DMT family transporter [Henriciella barbarensis]RIJ24285.1 DMT family transporter [Henriciella barbarensis]
MNWGQLLVGLGFICGTLIAAQGAINGRLASGVGGPIQAAFISFSIGWLALLAVNIALGYKVPSISQTLTVPAWAWIGGLIGAIMVASSATAVPRIGVAAWVSAVIAGQLTAAVLYDQFGAFGQAVRPATPLRLVGIGFLVLGVYLVRRF